jgi:hypothetical protein
MRDTNYELRAWMGANKVSGRELARLMGRSYETIRVKLRGQTEWTLPEIEKLLEVTGLTFEELFFTHIHNKMA